MTGIKEMAVNFPRWCSGKESACQCRRHKRHWFEPWLGKIPWRRKWQPTPVFLPGKFHGQRRLAGYSPKGHKELDTTEQLSTHTHTYREQCVQRPCGGGGGGMAYFRNCTRARMAGVQTPWGRRDVVRDVPAFSFWCHACTAVLEARTRKLS